MKNPEETAATNDTEDSRQPYEPPKMEIEELFEVVALSCGKLPAQIFRDACRRSPRLS